MSDTTAILERLDKIDARLSTIEERLFVGNGSPAMLVRLDRLEVQAERRKTNNVLVWTTILGILVCVVGERIAAHLDKSAPPVATAKP